MAISFVGANSAAANTLAIPAHQAGDILFMFALRLTGTAAPTVPAGWTSLATRSQSSISAVVAFRVATASGTTSGTWTNASALECLVYTPGSGTAILPTAAATLSGTGTTVSFPDHSVDADEVMFVRFYGTLGGGVPSAPPTGWSDRIRQGAYGAWDASAVRGVAASAVGANTQTSPSASSWIAMSTGFGVARPSSGNFFLFF